MPNSAYIYIGRLYIEPERKVRQSEEDRRQVLVRSLVALPLAGSFFAEILGPRCVGEGECHQMPGAPRCPLPPVPAP
jgi:hypothetical protein